MTATIQAGDTATWLRDGKVGRAMTGVVEWTDDRWAWMVVTGVESRHDRRELGRRWAVLLSELVRGS